MEHKTIAEAISAIYASINGYVQKTRSDGLRYSFASEADLIAKLRPAMVEHQVSVHVHAYSDIERSVVHTAKGAAMNVCTLRAVVRFVHGPSGTFLDVQALGEGADSGDKSGNKAMTCAYKYALRQTFAIETGDDPDRDQDNVYQQQPSAGVSASWAQDRDAFLAYLSGRGWRLEDVAEFCRALGKAGPDTMTHEARQSLTRWLEGAGGDRWSQFLAGRGR